MDIPSDISVSEMGISALEIMLAFQLTGAPRAPLPLPKTCGVCMEGNARKMAFGDFRHEIKNLLHYELPLTEQLSGLGRQEPWVFELIITRGGIPCSVTLVREQASSFTEAMSGSLQRWRFLPFRHRSGEPFCYRTKVFVYLRAISGNSTIIIPGVTDMEQAPR